MRSSGVDAFLFLVALGGLGCLVLGIACWLADMTAPSSPDDEFDQPTHVRVINRKVTPRP